MLQKVHGGNKERRPRRPQVLLTKVLEGLIRASARQIHPTVFREIVRNVGVEHGRLAASEWLAQGKWRRCDARACAECLEAVGGQCGWTLRVTVGPEDVLTITVQKCQVTVSREIGLYLCDLAAGLFVGVAVQTLGCATISVNQCSETPPLHCAFTIRLREPTPYETAPAIVQLPTKEESALFGNRPSVCEPVEHLTPREQQVLQLIAQGFSDKQIAKTLQRSARTIENHAARIRQKLRVENRTGLARFAIRARLIEP